MTTALKTRMNTLSVRVADRLDLAIEIATLGGYGLEPIPGHDGSVAGPKRPGTDKAPGHMSSAGTGCGQRDREVAREVSTPVRRGSCARPVRLIDAYAGAYCS